MTTIGLSPGIAAPERGACEWGRAFGHLAAGLPLDRLFAALAARRARRDLHALSDHLLKDIGVRRHQIRDSLRGGVPWP